MNNRANKHAAWRSAQYEALESQRALAYALNCALRTALRLAQAACCLLQMGLEAAYRRVLRSERAVPPEVLRRWM